MSRVLLVGKGPPETGGIPAYLQAVLESRLQHDHDIALLNLTRPGPPRGGRFHLANVAATIGDVGQLWRAAKGHDVVHIHSAVAPGVTALRALGLALVARARRSRVILHVHGGLLAIWMTTRRRRRLLRAVVRVPSTVVAVASSVADVLAPLVAAPRLVHIPNGVDLERFPAPAGPAPEPDVPPRILYVGLLTPRKGVLDLLEASAILHRTGIDHELRLAGGMPDEGPAAQEEVLAVAADANLLGTVPHHEMPAVYAAADIFCLPSWWEAMPLTVLEAMAAGRPVVATMVGDIPRMVADGETGLLVAPREPAELAAALARLIEDPELRERFGEAARVRAAQHYDLTGMLGQLDELYRRAS